LFEPSDQSLSSREFEEPFELELEEPFEFEFDELFELELDELFELEFEELFELEFDELFELEFEELFELEFEELFELEFEELLEFELDELFLPPPVHQLSSSATRTKSSCWFAAVPPVAARCAPPLSAWSNWCAWTVPAVPRSAPSAAVVSRFTLPMECSPCECLSKSRTAHSSRPVGAISWGVRSDAGQCSHVK
jgi:hypothetical protein